VKAFKVDSRWRRDVRCLDRAASLNPIPFHGRKYLELGIRRDSKHDDSQDHLKGEADPCRHFGTKPQRRRGKAEEGAADQANPMQNVEGAANDQSRIMRAGQTAKGHWRYYKRKKNQSTNPGCHRQ